MMMIMIVFPRDYFLHDSLKTFHPFTSGSSHCAYCSSVECTFEKRGGVFHPSTICSIFMVHIVVDDVPKLAKCKGYLGSEVL